jgi:cytochrome c oxidase accessory protein FixG
VHLPVIQEDRGSLRGDGRRVAIHPADVSGRFTRARNAVFAVLILIYVALPWIPIAGHPAVFLDIAARRFYLFGASFNAQDLWLTAFVLLGLGLALVVMTTLLGRVWCGWACPQTVFLEGIFRRVERLINGSREQRLRRARGPWTRGRVLRAGATHAAYALLSVLVAHAFLAYFVSVPRLVSMVQQSPAAHPEAFTLVTVSSALMYGNFAWFREQLCVIVCPYGRLQSVLFDADTLVVGYDVKRGEPRGKQGKTTGDCVDCKRCVVVCPTGIDIRQGLQLDCLACTACIDACDDVMDRLGRERGLIRYDSQRGLAGVGRRILRPRLLIYAAVVVALVIGAVVAFRERPSFEANLLRLPGPPFSVENGVVRNTLQIHLVNKQGVPVRFTLESRGGPQGTRFVVPLSDVTIAPMESTFAPVVVESPAASFHGAFPVTVRVVAEGLGEKTVQGTFLGPGGK